MNTVVTVRRSLVNATERLVAHYSISTVVSQFNRSTPVNRGERKMAWVRGFLTSTNPGEPFGTDS